MNGLLMRRRAMMAGKAALTPTTLYPFPNNSEGRYTITNGNRLEVTTGTVLNAKTLNLYTCDSTINNLPERFAIPAGSDVQFVYKVSELSRYGSTGRLNIGLRAADASTNLPYGSPDITETGEATAQFTATQNGSASCVYVYFAGIYSATIEISMYVDNVQWI